LSDHEAADDPHPQYTTQEEAANAAPVKSVNEKTGNVVLTPSDVGAEPANPAILKKTDVHDTPQDGATNIPISSNWAFDHAANKDHLPEQSGQSGNLLTTDGKSARWIPPTGVWATLDEAIAMAIALG